MKLFQIEEPDGSPGDRDAPGAAIGIDLSGALAHVAVSIGGNAAILADREGFARDLPVPAAKAAAAAWQAVFEGAKLRAERALGRPVTHAVVVVAETQPSAAPLYRAALEAGLLLLRLVTAAELGQGARPAEAAAALAEDMAPRPEAL